MNFRHQKQNQANKRNRKRKQNSGTTEDCNSPPSPPTNLDNPTGDSASKLFRISAVDMVDDNHMESLGAECEFKHAAKMAIGCVTYQSGFITTQPLWSFD